MHVRIHGCSHRTAYRTCVHTAKTASSARWPFMQARVHTLGTLLVVTLTARPPMRPPRSDTSQPIAIR